MVLNAIGAVLSVFIMIGLGVFVYTKRWATRENAAIFSKIVINIGIPANVLYSFLTIFNRSQITESFPLMLAGFVVMIVSYAIAFFIAPLVRIKETRRGLFSVIFAFSNSVFIGFPVAQALFGDAGMPYAVMYYLVNTTMFWTLGYFGIRRDAAVINGKTERVSLKEVLSHIFNMPLMFIVLGVLLMYLNVQLPAFIMRVLDYASGLTTPLSMIFTGIVLADLGIKSMVFEWDVLKVLFGRVLIVPLIMLLAVWLMGMEGLGPQVFVVQSSLPVMLQSVILSEHYHADAAFASKSFTWTTVMALVTIPAYMVLVNFIF